MNININLALKYLKRNKKRTITNIIAIIIVTMLLCGVIMMVSVYQNYMLSEMRDMENWEAKFENIPYEKVYALKENSDIKQVAVVKNIGIFDDDYSNTMSGMKFYINLKAYDDNAMQNLGIKLVTGRLPNKENEVVVSENYGGKTEKSIDITINGKKQTFQIVGTIIQPEFATMKLNYCEFGVITYLTGNVQDKDLVDASIIYKDVKNTYKYTEEIANVLKLYSNESMQTKNISYNDDLLHYSNIFNMNSEDDLKILGVSAFIIVLIIIVAITFLYSMFNISVEQRKKEFANLSSIGMTKKQIIATIFIEATILFAIGTIIGMTFSILLSSFGIKAVIDLVLGSNINLEINIPYVKLGIALLITAITTYISALKPAIQASKISIIESIKKTKKLKKSEINRKYRNIEEKLIYRNKQENRRKYLCIIVSITISIFLFIFTQGYIENSFKDIRVTKYNCNLTCSNKNYFDEIEKTLKNTKGVTDILGYCYSNHFTTLDDTKINDSLKYVMDSCPERFNNGFLAKNEVFCYFFSIFGNKKEEVLKKFRC